MARLITVALLALLAVSTFAVTTRMTAAQEKKITELKKEKWGKILFTLAELQIQSQGPFEELLEAVDALIEDIGDKIDENDEAYNERSLFHQSEVTRLDGQISSTNIAISGAENILNNILYPALEQLQFRLNGFHEEVNENNRYVEQITFERNEAHEAYEARVQEHNDALAAIDECLEILDQFGGAALSLIQVKKVQNSIKKITQKLHRGIEEVMIKSLITLASSEFADQSAILRVSNALTDIKNTIIEALNTEHADEASAQAQYEAEVKERESDNKRLGREINITNGEIDSTERRISDKETFLAIKQNDLANFTAELEGENEAFEEATTFYEDVRAELQREQAVANDTKGLLTNAGFSSTLTKNLGF